jgi:hypothetical protein
METARQELDKNQNWMQPRPKSRLTKDESGRLRPSLLLALTGHPNALSRRLFSEAKRTLIGLAAMSAHHPKRTLTEAESD